MSYELTLLRLELITQYLKFITRLLVRRLGILGRWMRKDVLVGAHGRAGSVADRDQDVLAKRRRHVAGREQARRGRGILVVDQNKPVRVDSGELACDSAVGQQAKVGEDRIYAQRRLLAVAHDDDVLDAVGAGDLLDRVAGENAHIRQP